MLTLYLDKIWPGEYGIAKPWYFLLEKIWKRKTNRNCINNSDENRLLPLQEKNLNPIVQLKGVTKIYDNHEAVSNLEMNIYKGSVTGLLGENGAGKSTTMSMIAGTKICRYNVGYKAFNERISCCILGLTKATSGNIYIDGININDNVELARKEVSFCTQHNLLYDELTVIQHLELFGMLKGEQSRKKAREQALELLRNTLGMEDKINTFVTELSGGMKRKLSLGIALMGNP
ncbi:ABC transporter ATP-binding protein, partial [Oryctes borbonicus]